MISTTALRNAFWCVVALVIVAGASAPVPLDKLPLARTIPHAPESAQFAEAEMYAAPSRWAAARAAADKRAAEVAARLADQAEVDAQIAAAARSDDMRANDIVVSQSEAARSRAGGMR